MKDLEQPSPLEHVDSIATDGSYVAFLEESIQIRKSEYAELKAKADALSKVENYLKANEGALIFRAGNNLISMEVEEIYEEYCAGDLVKLFDNLKDKP